MQIFCIGASFAVLSPLHVASITALAWTTVGEAAVSRYGEANIDERDQVHHPTVQEQHERESRRDSLRLQPTAVEVQVDNSTSDVHHVTMVLQGCLPGACRRPMLVLQDASSLSCSLNDFDGYRLLYVLFIPCAMVSRTLPFAHRQLTSNFQIDWVPIRSNVRIRVQM